VSTQDRYQPSTPDAVECPACGAVATTLPADMPLDMIALSHLRCSVCGQEWNECRVLGEHDYRRYWDPAPAPA
jgi:formate dehydrogenase maturation protein FdhE